MAIAAVALAGVGCGDDLASCDYAGHHYQLGDEFPDTDMCNTCDCTETGVSCTAKLCYHCGPSGGCPSGPACAGGCCGAGEFCANDTWCLCGGSMECGAGDHCEVVSQDGSGACDERAVCCGASEPCPP
jgi:hypothetical protein